MIQPATQEQLKEYLRYDQETGRFYWIWHIRCKARFVGKEAGTLGRTGYIRINIFGKRIQAHRLAWLYVYGYWPGELDHINAIKTDNRINNLREVTHAENMEQIQERRAAVVEEVLREIDLPD